ncbi:choice-of-anchor Q domain-containing protein [Marinobacter sp. chi1]|uniref:Choice-of-anchor Q domain-containing protein n=1 Tax=Marinobacter suaedae TaxID=3057675 RepID=A0ABT8W3J7_9GAMM|nr:choice-of-anchor Q domain-containing protein [Marinobacter sp. chi1]MDO3722809.1 choice-of-anchor Q domain-containing protein [Marinobacter sp. chi1]
MTNLSKAKPVLKPLVAMIALANAQMAFGCADVVVTAANASSDTDQTVTFDEAISTVLAGPDNCGSIRVDNSLAGQTLDWASTSLGLSGRTVTITGPSVGAATIAVSPTVSAFSENSSLAITDLKFVPNPDSLRVSTLVFVDSASSLSLDRAEFVGFDASSSSGGVISSSGTLNIADSVFEDNSSNGAGGAISVPTGQVTITGSEFRGNVAASSVASASGGAISGNTVQLTIEDSVFEANSSTGVGGAISTTTGSVKIASSEFRSNLADSSGGAISANTVELNIEDSVFDGNQSQVGSGGAINQVGESSGTLAVLRSEFRGNQSALSGGAIYQSSSVDLGIQDSVFEQNQAAANGGAVYVNNGSLGSPVSISKTTLANNSAGADGGGVYARIPQPGLVVESSTIHGNAAQTTGGGIFVIGYVSPPDIAINHSTITDNQSAGTAGYSAGALTADGAASIEISHTVIAGNTQGGEGTGNICVGESSTVVQAVLDYSFWDNTTNYDTSCTPPVADTSNILDEVDPGLGGLADNGGLTKTRFPMVDSPLLEAGNPNIMGEPETDQRGSARVLNGVIDIGAVESGNRSPVASAIVALEVTEGVPFTADASEAFSDPDGDLLSYAIDGEPDGAVVDATSGVISGTAQLAGEYTITVTASDTYGASASTTFALKVAESSSGSGSGGGGSFGVVLGLLAPLAIWRRLRRKA